MTEIMIFIGVASWPAFGFFTYGAFMADMYEISPRMAKEEYRRDVAYARLFALLGPLGFIAGAIATRGFSSGFRWRKP